MHHDQRFTLEKIAHKLRLLEGHFFRDSQPLPPMAYQPLPDARPLADVVIGEAWQQLDYGAYWGENRRDFLIKTRYRIPTHWPLDAPVALHLPLGENLDYFQAHPEALIYIDGQPFTAVDARHQLLYLSASHKDHDEHQLLLHGWTGLGGSLWGDERITLFMGKCQLVIVDEALRAFVTLARTAHQTAAALHDDDPTRADLLNALDDAFNVLDTRPPLADDFRASVAAAHARLQAGIDTSGRALDVTIYAGGHAHIDTAWLWTLAQTRGKATRSFYTAHHLMSRYADYCFMQSQPQLYEYIRQDAPQLFAAIQARVAEKRWELLGGMWVEADCNMSGAESLVRQFVLGRRYFETHFGADADSPILWLPDTFGFPHSLPQIARHAGIQYFFTIKMRWSEHNQIPYDSFWWQGLDGSRLLAHFSSTPEPHRPDSATYNAVLNAESVLATWRNARMKDRGGRVGLMAYGYGDGGGGPTMEMLEAAQVLADFPAQPRLRPARAIDFFEALSAHSDDLPVWDGELYLETHQGTLTSQAGIKRDMRQAENALHALEFAAIWAALSDTDYSYPAADLEAAWRIVCLNQFHDILPGSSIAEVYAEAREQFAALRRMVREHLDAALGRLARWAGGDVLIVNPSPCARADAVLWAGTLPDDQALFTASGEMVTTQRTDDGVLIALDCPAYSVTALHRGERPAGADDDASRLIARADLLENDYLRVRFNAIGDITAIYDKLRRRDILPDGALANQFQLFEDRPRHYDSWNIDPSYNDRCWTPESGAVRVVACGAVRATLEIKRAFMGSDSVQYVHLYHDRRQLDFETQINWRERQMLLKVAFPTNIHSNQAAYDIQWGHIYRPTHQNTSWDWARYEVPAHHWADVSEDDYGVSLLNNCKYGYDVRDGVLRLTLLKSATYPDTDADAGEHRFTYSLRPHDGDLGAVIAAGYALNHPALVMAGTGEPAGGDRALVSAFPENIIVETIKREEDGDGLVIRLYESRRRRGEVALKLAFPIGAAWRTDALERQRQPIQFHADTLHLEIRPFEIVTLVVYPR